MRAPRLASVCRLAWVAGCRYICWFMAGATATGAGEARQRVVSSSSAMPVARRAIRLAVAGATITQTQSAIELETLISQFLYSKAADASDAPAAKP